MGTFVPLNNKICSIRKDKNRCLDCIDLQIEKGEGKDCCFCENISVLNYLLGIKFGLLRKTPKWAYIRSGSTKIYKIPFEDVVEIKEL